MEEKEQGRRGNWELTVKSIIPRIGFPASEFSQVRGVCPARTPHLDSTSKLLPWGEGTKAPARTPAPRVLLGAVPRRPPAERGARSAAVAGRSEDGENSVWPLVPGHAAWIRSRASRLEGEASAKAVFSVPVRQALGPARFCSLGFLVSLSIKTRDCLPIRMITRFLGFQTNLREAVLNTGVKHRSEYRCETSRGEGWGWGESGFRAPSPTAAKRLSTGCSQRVLLLRTSLGPKFSGEIFSP